MQSVCAKNAEQPPLDDDWARLSKEFSLRGESHATIGSTTVFVAAWL